MNWSRIMLPGLDAVSIEGLHDGSAAFCRHTQGIDVPDMAMSRQLAWQFEIRDLGERLTVPAGNAASALGPILEMPQFHAKYRALDAVHAEVESLVQVVVLAVLAPVAQHA